MTTTVEITAEPTTGERADLLRTLAQHRFFLRYTVRELTDEQAGLRPTASELCLGGLIKHVTATEKAWMDFVAGNIEAVNNPEGRDDQFRMLPTDTLSEVLDRYEEVALRTDRIVADLPDLDVSQPLPEAPWFEPGARWSARRVLLHVLAETSQHAGHADIIRETLDGGRTMG